MEQGLFKLQVPGLVRFCSVLTTTTNACRIHFSLLAIDETNNGLDSLDVEAVNFDIPFPAVSTDVLDVAHSSSKSAQQHLAISPQIGKAVVACCSKDQTFVLVVCIYLLLQL